MDLNFSDRNLSGWTAQGHIDSVLIV